jgi:hypothetical protein
METLPGYSSLHSSIFSRVSSTVRNRCPSRHSHGTFHGTIERFVAAVLHWFARRDETQLHLVLVHPLVHRPRSELRAIVDDYWLRHAALDGAPSPRLGLPAERAATVRRLQSSLMLLQYPDDLFFAISAHLHPSSFRSIYERPAASIGREFREQVMDAEKSTEKISKLVEVVRSRHVDILVHLHLSSFRDRWNTENNDRNVLTQSGSVAYSLGGRDKFLAFKG